LNEGTVPASTGDNSRKTAEEIAAEQAAAERAAAERAAATAQELSSNERIQTLESIQTELLDSNERIQDVL